MPMSPEWLADVERIVTRAGALLDEHLEQAGGAASTGAERILDVQPLSLHQKVPLIIGSRDDVREYKEFYKEAAASAAD